MGYTALYHPEVENDIYDAKDWYKDRQKGLDKRFVKEVKRTVRTIVLNPLIFQKRYKEVRVAYTKIFPFGVHFYVNEREKMVFIVGIFHTSLNPERWRKRML